MLMALIFIALFIAVVITWLGKRQAALYIFSISFISAIVVFIYHMSDVIGLSL